MREANWWQCGAIADNGADSPSCCTAPPALRASDSYQHFNTKKVTRIMCSLTKKISSLAFACCGLISPAALLADPEILAHDALFNSDEPLAITLTGPFKTLDKQRDKTAEYEVGSLSYDGPDGPINIETRYTPRGNFRLEKENCSHAQLWLNLKKKQTRETLFANQNKLKLVVQCRDSNRYQSYLRKEYQAYRMLNLITDTSYRVRWLTVTYQDLQGKKPRTQPAFLIEHKSRVADRLNLNTVDAERISRTELDPEHATLAALFNYFVGNADFSMIAGTGGSCCHNSKLFRADDGPYIPVIYDFDSSGYVDAPYAITPAKLGLRNIRQRIYRGFCTDPEVLDGVLNEFRDKRESLLAIASETDFSSKRSARKGVSYLEDFYDVIDDPKRFKTKITEVCR